MPKQYPRDFRERAVRLVNESVGDHETEWATIQRVSSRLGSREGLSANGSAKPRSTLGFARA